MLGDSGAGYSGIRCLAMDRTMGVIVAWTALACGGPTHEPKGDAGGALATTSQALNATLPEVPALARDVAMIIGNQYTRPTVPP